ncbi:MAG: UbiD family decarboxylase [Clostridia bacterium]|nr:MAG: UbiD family decarboxylase [Clostridia bacterium]
MEFPFASLREWLSYLEVQGQLQKISTPVNLRHDLGYVSKTVADLSGPALLYENVEGYLGWRIFSDGLTTLQRRAWALGLRADDLSRRVAEVLMNRGPIKPLVVNTGPCKEIKVFGQDVDLTDLPIPYTGVYDNPPYITAGISTIQDLESGWVNIAVRRFQLKGQRRLCDLVVPSQHEGRVFARYVRAGQPMPIAIVIWADPLFYLVSQLPAADGVSEWNYWGAFAGQPLPVVKCETSDLLVPAAAEIIIEGVVDPRMREFEGPFCEFPGYYSGCYYCPVVQVQAVTMRAEPIYYYMYMGKEPSEGHNMAHLMYSGEIVRQLQALVPEVRDANVLSTWSFTTAVSIDKQAKRAGLVSKVGMALKTVKGGATVKNIMVFDDDVDIHNLNQVLWAFSVRFQPARDIFIMPETLTTPLDPSSPVMGKGPGVTSVAVYDCTEPGPPYDEPFKRQVAIPARSVTAVEILQTLGLLHEEG